MTIDPFDAAVGQALGEQAPQPLTQGPTVQAPPKLGADPFDDAVGSVIADETMRLKSNLMGAVRTKPEAVAEARRLSQRTGTPADVALRNLEEVRRHDQMTHVDATLANAPALRQQFLDPGFAAIAHDDVDNLSKFEVMVNSFKRAWPAFKSIVPGIELVNSASGLDVVNKIDARLAAGESILSIPAKDFPMGQAPYRSSGDPAQREAKALENWGLWRADYQKRFGDRLVTSSVEAANLQREQAAIPGAAVTRRVMAAKDFQDALSAFSEEPGKFILDVGPQSLAQNLPAMAASLATSFGGPQNPIMIMGLNSFITDYSSQITQVLNDKGIDTSDAAAMRAALSDPVILADVLEQASKHAAVVGSVDALSMGIAGKLTAPSKVLAGKPLTREVANIALQMPIQGTLGAAGELGGQVTAGQEIQPGQAVGEFFGEFFGGPVEVATASAGRIRQASQERQARLQAAAQEAQTVGGMIDLAGQSRVRERDPAAFAASVQSMAESNEAAPKAVHIDARLLGESLDQSGLTPEQIQQSLPSVAQQIEEARAIGGDVVIPIGEAMAFAPGSTLEQTFRDHARSSADGLSAVEVQQADQMTQQFIQTQIQDEVATVQRSEALRTGRDEVMATVLNELTTANRLTADANKTNALLAANFYAVMAERLGVTPQEFYQRYPLRVMAETPSGVALNQPPVDRAALPARFGWLSDEQLSVAQQILDSARSTKAKFIGLRAIDGHEVAPGESLRPSRKWIDGVQTETELAGTSTVGIKTDSLESILDGLHNLGALGKSGPNGYYVGKQVALVVGKTRRKGADVSEAVLGEAKVVDVWSKADDGLSSVLPKAASIAGTLNQGAQSPRGQFSPTALTISLLQRADLSTFVHELGHFFLEVQADLASQPGALEQQTSDMNALLAWFGVQDLATWRAMSLDDQRPYHEKFAESFEQYLFEGRAPSAELQPMFSTFRAWLTSVYKSLSKFLQGRNLNLTDEVRGVFDRMLASDEAIREAQTLREYFPLFTDQATSGMTPDEWTAYQRQGNDAVTAAQEDMQTRSLRDMQWLANARSRALKKLQREAKAKRAAMEAEVAEAVDATPIEQARRKLKELQASNTTDRAAIAEIEKQWRETAKAQEAEFKAQVEAEGNITSAAARKAEVKQRMLEWEAQNEMPLLPLPEIQMDALAEAFGFTSGAELTAKLQSEPKRAAAIQAQTDQRMLETYGDTTTPEGIERAANEAVHNEARGQFIASEFRAAQRIGRSEQEVNGRRQLSTAPLIKAAKQFAASLIARKKVRDVSPAPHEAAEVRAGKAAREAMAASDMQALEVATRDRMLQFYAAREARAALAEIEKKVDYLKKFDKESIRKNLPPEYVDQIDQLLERFDLRRSTSNTEIDRRKSLNEWIESQRADGIEPNLPELVMRNAQMVSYKELTVEEFRGLVDSVKQIEHFGRLKNKLLTSKDQREFEAVREILIKGLVDNSQGRQSSTRTPTTPGGRAWQGIKNFGSAHIKAGSWARIFDGGKDGGAFWEYLIRPANEAGNWETKMRAEASEKLQAIMAPAVKGQNMNKGQFFPSVNRSFTKQERLAVALNMGNAGNAQRLLGGEGWTMEQIRPVLESLSAADWKAVQGVWDHLESYKPLIAAKERRISGVEPDWVESKALTVQTSDGQTVNLRGGYYPVKYDPSASIRSEQDADAESARQQLRGAYSAPTTRRSFIKARADEVVGRPLLYDLSGLYSGVNDVIHDLAWHEWLIDANRLLKDKKVDSAIRETYGPGAARQLKTWRESIAEGDGAAQAAIDGALGLLRRSVSVAGLGFNVMSAAMQPLGMTQTIVRIGAKWAGKGIGIYLKNPVAAMRTANEMSSFMASRQKTQFRDMNELRNRVAGKTGPLTTAQTYSFWLMMRVQQMVDVPTWHGAYEKAVSEGNDDVRAVALADQAVIDAQGSGMNKDQSAIEGGGPAQKLFTVFYSFMNTALNLGVVQGMTASSKAKFAVDMLMLYSVPAVLGAALKMALTPGDLDDDDIMKRLAASQVSYLFGMVVLGRETQSLATGMLGLDSHFQDYKGPAGLRAFVDLFALGKQVKQGEFDDAFRKAAVNSMGSLFGLPAAQINRTWTGTEALAEGETNNPLAVLFGNEKPR